jgi:uncharacterized membrane protein YdjX (TVP38/TMEM64 family)
VIALGICAFAILIHFWHLGHYQFSLTLLKDHVADLRVYYHDKPLLTVVGWFLISVILYTFAIPGAGMLDMGAGAVFGVGPGLVLMLASGVVGSMSAFLAGRYLFRDWAEKRLADRAERLREGFEQHGNLYLLSLRMIPFMPHFVLNFGVAFTRMTLKNFLWVTLIGNLPLTWALVNAGTALANITSLDDVMTPKTILALCSLGAMPLLALAAWVVLKRWGKVSAKN